MIVIGQGGVSDTEAGPFLRGGNSQRPANLSADSSAGVWFLDRKRRDDEYEPTSGERRVPFRGNKCGETYKKSDISTSQCFRSLFSII